jgi:hypothetical protein
MKGYCKTTFAKAAVWLAAELLLNFVGLDTLADYSEFLFEKELTGGEAIAIVQTSVF